MIERNKKNGDAYVEVTRSGTVLVNTPSGGMVAVARGAELGYPKDGGQEVGDRSVEAVIDVLSDSERAGWIAGVEETDPLSPKDCAGMDLLIYCTDRFALMTGVSGFTVEVKSSPERMEEYLRICCLKGMGTGANRLSSEKRRKMAFEIMAREGRVLTNGRWANNTILAHITAQVAEIARVITSSDREPWELYPGDFYAVLLSLGDKTGSMSYQIAETALETSIYSYRDMYGLEMRSEADLYIGYLDRQAHSNVSAGESGGGAMPNTTIFSRDNVGVPVVGDSLPGMSGTVIRDIPWQRPVAESGSSRRVSRFSQTGVDNWEEPTHPGVAGAGLNRSSTKVRGDSNGERGGGNGKNGGRVNNRNGRGGGNGKGSVGR